MSNFILDPIGILDSFPMADIMGPALPFIFYRSQLVLAKRPVVADVDLITGYVDVFVVIHIVTTHVATVPAIAIAAHGPAIIMADRRIITAPVITVP